MQRRKRKTAVSKAKRKKTTYFRAKAKTTSARKTSSTHKKTRRAARSSAKRVAKSARRSARIVRKSARRVAKATSRTIKKTKRRTLRATKRSVAKTARVRSAISKYFLSSDIAKQTSPSVASAYKKAFEKKVELTSALNTGLKGRQKRSRLSRFEIMKRNLMIMVRRLLSWFSRRSVSINMTVSGKRALSQLEDLYDLLILEAMDEESLLRLKVAYGEACYYVTQASRGYHKRHSGRGHENYRPYFDRFVDASS